MYISTAVKLSKARHFEVIHEKSTQYESVVTETVHVNESLVCLIINLKLFLVSSHKHKYLQARNSLCASVLRIRIILRTLFAILNTILVII